jgi:hypothetical protein
MTLKMRRAFSILLVLVFALGPLAFTLDFSDDAGLPLCCRRHGAHHCAMRMADGRMAGSASAAQTDSAPAVSAPLTCPHYPGATALLSGPHRALVAAATRLPALTALASAPALRPIVAASRPSEAHAGRGPPFTI